MIVKTVKGAMMTLRGLNPNADIAVRIKRDNKGKSLSLAYEDIGVMLLIPLEPIETELKEVLKDD